MPQQQMTELTKALETFNNVSLPALAFFFAVMFLIVIGILLRGVFGRDARRDDLLALQMKNSSDNGVAITGVKQDIADALKGIREDRTKADAQHDRTIRVLSARVKGYDGNINKLQTTTGEIADAINKVNDGIAEINRALPTLAKKSEMDLAIGRMDDAIKRLEEAKRDCIEAKHKTGEIPLIPLPATMDITLHTPKDDPPELKEAS